MTALDGSSGMVPGVLPPRSHDVFTLPTSTRVEVLNLGRGVLHVAVNPAGDDFTPWTPGSQVIQSGESAEIAVTSTPTIVVKSEAVGGPYQVRRLA